MKICITGTAIFDVVKAVKDLVNEVRFEFDEKELKITCMDPANVSLIILRMPSSSCIEYNVKENESFGINLSNLATILKRGAKEDDMTTLETKDGTKNGRLDIKINQGRKFTVPLIDIEDKSIKIPELDFKSVVEMDVKDLQQAVADVKIISDSAWLEVNKDSKFIVSGEGDLSKARIEVADVTVKSEQRSKSKYALEYLEKMVTAVKTDKAKVELSTDYPLRLTLNAKAFSVKYILAPRVSDSDEDDNSDDDEKKPETTAVKPQQKPAVQNKSKPNVEEQEEEEDEVDE